ncbi:MAG: EAL domain-containing protein, partial [Candidatus Accumulibacter sp.]|nr:EAL domain-containing protein [Accumulibacter sp.]
MRAFWRQSILARAAMQVAAAGLAAGLGFVLLSAHRAEQRDLQEASRRVAELVRTVEGAVQLACLNRDAALATGAVAGLIRSEEVFGAAITTGDRTLAELRKNVGAEPARRARAEAGRIRRAIASPREAGRIVGELAVDPDDFLIAERARQAGISAALAAGVPLAAVIAVIAAVVLLCVVRPVKRLSDGLHAMDPRSVVSPPVPPGCEDDEIGRLSVDIGRLARRLTDSLEEERRQHAQREIDERRYRAIFENADSGLFVIDRRARLESCNGAFFRQLGLRSPAERGERLDLTALGWREPAALSRLVKECAVRNHPASDDFEYELPDGGVVWLNIALTPIGEQRAQGQLTDISRHKQAQISAQREAVTDSLTGLLNRAGFLQRVDREIVACAGERDAGFALMIADLRGFRRVNEALGLDSGDKILSITAHRLRSCVKSSDFVSRLSNDSFGIVLRSVAGEETAASVGARITVAMKGYFEVGGPPLQLGASVGIALFPRDGGDRETLLRNAEMALDHARAGGGGRYCFFDFSMASSAENRRRLENDLRFAVRRDELAIHYQPIVDLFARRMAGVEALIRWRHPRRGLTYPDAFIPLAEETGDIVGIGLWTVDTVCRQLADWKRQGIDRYISINVSARQIPEGLPPITLIETVDRYGVEPANLAIEITESLFMGHLEAAQTWLDAVHDLGFPIYLDDFGTGYSSLSYIKRFPVDVLKVDKSFVRDMNEDNSDRALVGAIVNMARSLELTVVAEGV